MDPLLALLESANSYVNNITSRSSFFNSILDEHEHIKNNIENK